MMTSAPIISNTEIKPLLTYINTENVIKGNTNNHGVDWNSKNTFWGFCLSTTRGRQLLYSVTENNLHDVSAHEPTYWPIGTNKIPDILDFSIIKGLFKQ